MFICKNFIFYTIGPSWPSDVSLIKSWPKIQTNLWYHHVPLKAIEHFARFRLITRLSWASLLYQGLVLRTTAQNPYPVREKQPIHLSGRNKSNTWKIVSCS